METLTMDAVLKPMTAEDKDRAVDHLCSMFSTYYRLFKTIHGDESALEIADEFSEFLKGFCK